MKASKILNKSYCYRLIDSMFDSGFEADEVLEICDDHEVRRVDAVVTMAYYLRHNGRDDTFKIDCVEAERYFRPDGSVKVELYLGIKQKFCERCGDEWDVYPTADDPKGWCAVCEDPSFYSNTINLTEVPF